MIFSYGLSSKQFPIILDNVVPPFILSHDLLKPSYPSRSYLINSLVTKGFVRRRKGDRRSEMLVGTNGLDELGEKRRQAVERLG